MDSSHSSRSSLMHTVLARRRSLKATASRAQDRCGRVHALPTNDSKLRSCQPCNAAMTDPRRNVIQSIIVYALTKQRGERAQESRSARRRKPGYHPNPVDRNGMHATTESASWWYAQTATCCRFRRSLTAARAWNHFETFCQQRRGTAHQDLRAISRRGARSAIPMPSAPPRSFFWRHHRDRKKNLSGIFNVISAGTPATLPTCLGLEPTPHSHRLAYAYC